MAHVITVIVRGVVNNRKSNIETEGELETDNYILESVHPVGMVVFSKKIFNLRFMDV